MSFNKINPILNAWPDNQSESMDFFWGGERAMAYGADRLTQ